MTLVRRIRPWCFRIGLTAAVIGLAILARRYDIERLSDEVHSLDGLVRRGAVLVFAMVDETTALGDGTLVEAEVPAPGGVPGIVEGQRYRVLSRIAAGPGQRIAFGAAAGGRFELLVDGRHTWSTFLPAWQEGVDPGRRLKEGVIPAGHYLLLDPAANLDGFDSRRLGLLPRERLVRKILSHL